MTEQQKKLALYQRGRYLMPVPPVSTTYWTVWDWINFIDSNGKWLCGNQ